MYAKQVFYEAVLALATSPDSIQKRLNYAAGALSKIALLGSADEDLPPENRSEFRAIWSELSDKTVTVIGNEGTIAATTRKLTDEQGRDLATRILSIYTDIMGGL